MTTNYQERAGYLNRHVSRLHPRWGNLPIWERAGQPSIVHMTYSAVLAVIQEESVEWTALKIEDEEYREKTSFALTFWTADLVVHAVRLPGNLRPTVSISKRSDLVGLELLSAPLVTTSDWDFHDETASVRLTYPSFEATLRESEGEALIAALPSFIADL